MTMMSDRQQLSYIASQAADELQPIPEQCGVGAKVGRRGGLPSELRKAECGPVMVVLVVGEPRRARAKEEDGGRLGARQGFEHRRDGGVAHEQQEPEPEQYQAIARQLQQKRVQMALLRICAKIAVISPIVILNA